MGSEVLGAASAGFAVVVAAGVVLVKTRRVHAKFSADSTIGIQKVHVAPTPRIGGIAVGLGAVAAWLGLDGVAAQLLGIMLLAGAVALAAGLLEDFTKKVGVRERLLATLASGVIACLLSGIAMKNTGVSFFDTALTITPFAIAFTAFAVGGVANSVNIIDGFNGLAAGSVAIMFAAMSLIALRLEDFALFQVGIVLTFVSLGFVAVNWPHGKIFLGDGGAYFLGFLLGWMAILLPMRNPGITAWTTLLVCAYPVIEVAFSCWRRSRRDGHHPGQPDRVHLHTLMYRRLSRQLWPDAPHALQNARTSPFAWMFTLLPCAWAVTWPSSIPALAVGLAVTFAVYYALYMRLSQFKWCFMPTSSRRLRPA